MENKFIIYGKNPIKEALISNKSIEKIYVAYEAHIPKAIFDLFKEKNVKFQIVPAKKIDEITKTKKNQGIAAILSPISYKSDKYIFDLAFKENGFIIVLDHITDPQNVGSILRTAEVFGSKGIILPKDRSAPINEVVVKSSSGAIFHLNIARVSSIYQSLKSFKDMGGWIFALDLEGKSLKGFNFVFPMALVLGSEGQGVSKSLKDLAHDSIFIDMKGKVESLNVSNAAAITMWEISKQLPKN